MVLLELNQTFPEQFASRIEWVGSNVEFFLQKNPAGFLALLYEGDWTGERIITITILMSFLLDVCVSFDPSQPGVQKRYRTYLCG